MGVVIRQKVKGRGNPWWVFVTHNGKRTSRKVGDRKAAEAVASTIRAKLGLGEFGFDMEEKKPEPTFKEYANSWIKTTVPATCKDSTVRDYKDMLRLHILPSFGNQKIVDITRGQIKDFLFAKIKGGYSKSTVSHLKDVISGVLNKAMDDEVISANPTYRLFGKSLKAKNQTKIDPLTKDELKKLLDSVQEHFPRHYPLFLLLARTGLRIGEALVLKWSDIDFNGRFIKVQRGISRGKIDTPKNDKDRKVDMSKQLTETLWKLKQEREKKGIPQVVFQLGQKKTEQERKDLPEWIFVNENGLPMDKDNWRRRVFNKALEKAGLRRIRIHDLRHSYASLRISKGDNIADVSNQLGHHSVKFTMDVYYHWMPGKKKQEVDALDDPITEIHPSAPYTHPKPLKSKKGLAG